MTARDWNGVGNLIIGVALLGATAIGITAIILQEWPWWHKGLAVCGIAVVWGFVICAVAVGHPSYKNSAQ